MARRSDMDMNGHINNATYLAWALETVPDEVFNHSKLFEVREGFDVGPSARAERDQP